MASRGRRLASPAQLVSVAQGSFIRSFMRSFIEVRSVFGGRWLTDVNLDEFDEDPAAVLGMSEVDQGAGRASPGLLVEHAHTSGAQGVADRGDVGDPIGHLLDAWTIAVEELGDGGVWPQRGKQLHAGIAGAEHGLDHALLLVRFSMRDRQAEGLLVKVNRRVQIGHRQADVVDRLDECIRPQCLRVTAHAPIVTAMDAETPLPVTRVRGSLPALGLRPTRRAVLQASLVGAIVLGGTTSCARSATSTNQVVFSNWPLYLDVPEPGVPSTLELFTERTGIEVLYQEDINDGQTFYAKVRDQLESGRGIDRDIVVFSEETAQLFVELGFAQPLDYARIPNAVNLLPRLAQASFDPNRAYTLPWQSGFTGFGFNAPLLNERTGWTEMTSFEQFFDERLKGRISVLGETMDTMGPMLAWQGFDPSNFTDAQFEQTLDVLAQYVERGFIRQVTGNDYIAGLESGDLIASIGWSGDVLALGDEWGFALPESGGIVWADSMLIPIGAPNKSGAEDLMNHYYDPVIAAQVAAWIQYVCPVSGAQEAMRDVDPALVDDPWIFPSTQVLDSCYVTQALSLERSELLDRQFDRVMGL